MAIANPLGVNGLDGDDLGDSCHHYWDVLDFFKHFAWKNSRGLAALCQKAGRFADFPASTFSMKA
jgi:hypothetical protein